MNELVALGNDPQLPRRATAGSFCAIKGSPRLHHDRQHRDAVENLQPPAFCKDAHGESRSFDNISNIRKPANLSASADFLSGRGRAVSSWRRNPSF